MASWDRILNLAQRNDTRARQAVSDRNVSDILLAASKARRDALDSIVAEPVVAYPDDAGATGVIDASIQNAGLPALPSIELPAAPVLGTAAPVAATASLVPSAPTLQRLKPPSAPDSGAVSALSTMGIDSQRASDLLRGANRFAVTSAGVGDLNLAAKTANEILQRRTVADNRAEQAYVDAIDQGVNRANRDNLYIGDYGRIDSAINGARTAMRNNEDNAASASNTEMRVQSAIANGMRRSVDASKSIALRAATLAADMQNAKARLAAAGDKNLTRILDILIRHMDNRARNLTAIQSRLLDPNLLLYSGANATGINAVSSIKTVQEQLAKLDRTNGFVSTFVNTFKNAEGTPIFAGNAFAAVGEAMQNGDLDLEPVDQEAVKDIISGSVLGNGPVVVPTVVTPPPVVPRPHRTRVQRSRAGLSGQDAKAYLNSVFGGK